MTFCGFSQYINYQQKKLFLDNSREIVAENINPYLLDAPDVLVSSRSKPICDVPKMILVNKPADGGNLIYKYVLENSGITTTQAMKLLGIKQRRTREILSKMIENGWLRKEGASRSTIYVNNTEGR